MKCDLTSLMAVKNAEHWSCDKPVIEGKVSKNAKCNIVCPVGHDLVKGKSNFHSSIAGQIIYPVTVLRVFFHKFIGATYMRKTLVCAIGFCSFKT